MRHRNRITRAVIFLLLIAAATAYAGDGVSVRAFASKSAITIGDRIKYVIEVTAPRLTQVQMPVFKDSAIGDFEIKDSSSTATERLFGKKVIRSQYYITAYYAGKKKIPQLNIKYKLKNAKDWAVKKTLAVPIEVRSVLPKELPADIKDIKGPESFFEVNWFVVGGVALLIAFLFAAFIAYMKRRNMAPMRLPHETALEELEAIRSQLLAGGDLKEYFVGVSDCIRRYIERVFALKAPEMTTEEFLNSLRDSGKLASGHKDLLRGFMNACDLVKFAKYKPTGEEAENVYTTARNFVEETKEEK